MRAWAARVGRGRQSFCEQCGAAGALRAERQVADRPRGGELLPCRGCSLLTCASCWPGPFLVCRACCVRQDPVLVSLVGEAPPRANGQPETTGAGERRRARPGRAGALAAAAVLVLAVVGGAIALNRPRDSAGGVAGLTATSSPTAPTRTGDATATATPAQSPAGTTNPGTEASPRPDPTPEPGTPADLRVASSVIHPWVDALGEQRAQLLVGVTNRGGSPGYLPSAGSSWQVLARDGFAVSRGRFAHVFPRLVEPGATAWLVDALSATFTESAELAELSVALDARDAAPSELTETETLTVSDVEWRVEATGTLWVSGMVENVGSRPIGRWSAGVVLLGADGTPLAAAYEIGDVDRLAPGATARFSTSYPGSAPVEEEEVATVVAAAVPLD